MNSVSKENFNKFIEQVEIESADLERLCADEKKKLFGYGEDNLVACPWISLWCEKSKSPTEVKGIFMMQDWWKKDGDVTLENQVAYLKECFSKNPDDQTLKNFLNKDHQWKGLVNSGAWLVTNAVWALRPPDAKATGYLGDSIHKKAFMVWVKVVLHFAKDKNFKLVIAGEWGVFGKERMPSSIQDYLEKWVAWSGQQSNTELKKKIKKAKGIVQFCPHPFTWNFISYDLIRGPG